MVGNQPKKVSTGQNEGLLEKYDLRGPKACFHLNQCLKKIKKRFPLAEISFFKKYWSSSNGSNGLKENINERISFPLNRKSYRICLKYISKRWENCFQ